MLYITLQYHHGFGCVSGCCGLGMFSGVIILGAGEVAGAEPGLGLGFSPVAAAVFPCVSTSIAFFIRRSSPGLVWVCSGVSGGAAASSSTSGVDASACCTGTEGVTPVS